MAGQSGSPLPGGVVPARPQSCGTCKRLRKTDEKSIVVDELDLLDKTVGDGRLKKGDKDRLIATFLNAVNAMINEGGGLVYIHDHKKELLGFFDEQVDNKLQSLIPDAESFFCDFFERHWKTKDHLVFRVKPRQLPEGPERRMSQSIVAFNSRVSLDKGLTNMTYTQLRFLMSGARENNLCQVESTLHFKQGDYVMQDGFEFQECVNKQAKRFNTTQPKTDKDMTELKKYCWDKSHEYMTAFTKLSGGGSVYFGIEEETIVGPKKWKLASAAELTGIISINGKNWKAWVDDNNIYYVTKNVGKAPVGQTSGNSLRLPPNWRPVKPADVKKEFTVDTQYGIFEDDRCKAYYISKEEDVPLQSEKKTGKFICRGIQLNQDQRQDLLTHIKRNVTNEMLWVTDTEKYSDPQNPYPVSVHFHNAEEGPNAPCVVEVQVQPVKGLVFYDSEGPVYFQLTKGKDPKADRVKSLQFISDSETPLKRSKFT